MLDRWILSRLEATTRGGDRGARRLRAAGRGDRHRRLVDDVSNWYVRRSRRRFWRTDPAAPPSDTLAAHATLHEVLDRVAVLLAPLCPFLADHFFAGLRDAGPRTTSVHLVDWPVADRTGLDDGLETEMAVARELVSLGRAARGEAGIKVRQPLRRAIVFLPPGTPPPPAGHRGGRAQRRPTSSTPTSCPTCSPTSCTPTSRRSDRGWASVRRCVRPALGALDAAARGPCARGRRADRRSGSMASTSQLGRRRRRAPGARRGGLRDLAGGRLRRRARPRARRRARGVAASIRELVRQVQELRKERGLRCGRPHRAVARGHRARRRRARDSSHARCSPTRCARAQDRAAERTSSSPTGSPRRCGRLRGASWASAKGASRGRRRRREARR